MAKSFKVLGEKYEIEFEKILDRISLADGDVVSLSGTLIEGIGNRHSDIDVNVFSAKRPRFDPNRHASHAFVHKPDMSICETAGDEILMTMDYYPNTAFHLDVEYWTYDALESIIEKVENNFEEMLKTSDFNYTQTGLTRVEKLVLNRTSYGLIIYGDKSWAPKLVDRYRSKYAYVLYRGLANNYWVYKDICGALEVGNDLMACELAREFLMSEIRAAIHLNGETNSTPKWSLVYWKKLGTQGYSHLYDRTIELLFSIPALHARTYVEAVMRLVEDIELVNIEVLSENAMFPDAQRMLSLLDEEISVRKDIVSPVQDHEFLFRRRSFDKSGQSYVDLLYFL